MKIIVQEHINAIVQPIVKKFIISPEKIGFADKISESIGIMKGDIIVFRGEGDPVRFSAGSATGKVLTTDPTTETGWTLTDGGGGGGGSTTTTLHNGTNEIILAGTVVKLSTGEDFVKATAGDTVPLFVVSEQCGVNEDADCYSINNTVCMIRCTSDAVAIGDSLKISSTAGVCDKRTSNTDRQVATALSAKASGSAGTVKALLSNINPYGVLAVTDGGTGATSAANACANLGAVKKSGDSVSGKLTFSSTTPIAYQGTKATNDMIRFMNNTSDTYGNGISIGGGGATIIGGGEAASSAEASTNAGDEKLILCNDGAIDIWTNCQSGVASATKKQIDTSGNFTGNAANVTGTVAIAHGGTGATTAAAARNALGLGNTTGALPAANGGTGQTSLQAARNAMGLGNTTGALPIANGGTGATTRLNALKALTNESVGTSATYFLTITNSWGKGGYTTVADAKTVLGIADSGWVTLNSSIPTYYRRIGAIVNVIVPRKQVSNGSTTLGTLPSGYRPKGLFRQVTEQTGILWSREDCSYLEINTNGVVTLVNNGANNDYFSANVTFITA